MSGDRSATKVLDVTKDFGERCAEIEVWRVPPSQRYPNGVKYTMQYGTVGGQTIVRYDNFPDHPGVTKHHKHTSDGRVVDIEFETIQALVRQFKSEVSDRGDEW